MRYRHLIFFFLLTFITGNVFAQHYKDSLDAALDNLYTRLELPGLSAVIVSQQGIIYQKSIGYADIAEKKPFSINTIQNIGSVSKTFIAVALMKAIEKGYFNLETDINTILPFKVVNPYFPGLPIRIKDLVTHTSGIVDNDSIYHKSYLFKHNGKTAGSLLAFMNEQGYTGGIKDTTLGDFMYNYLAHEGRLYNKKNFSDSKPGARSSYSNIGSALIAYLIALKAGISFAAFTEKYILAPLQMTHSSWFLDSIPLSRHAIPYFNKASAFPFYSLITYPDGGLRTSTGDLTRYVSAMMRSLNGRPVLLSAASYRLMFTPAFSMKNLPENFSLKTRNKGVLWNLYNDGFIGHDGDDPGVSTNIVFNKDIGIIFFTNIYIEDRSEIVEVLKRYGVKLTEKK